MDKDMGELTMANLEDINRRIQQENDRHKRVINDLDDKKCRENEHHQRTMESLRAEKERLRSQNQQLEEYNNTLNRAIGA